MLSEKIIKKVVSVLPLFVAMILLLPINVMAADKNLSITLAKDYVEADFIFVFEDEQEHNIVITDPNGVETIKKSDVKNVLVKIPDAVAGIYDIKVSAEKDISVNVSCECINPSVKEHGEGESSESSYTVSNVKTFFTDGNLNMTFSNAVNNRVNIVVTDILTGNVVANDIVSGNEYSLALSETVRDIAVYIVPVDYAYIDGSGDTYKYSVVRDVKAILTKPEIEKTSFESIDIKLTCNEKIGVKVTDNGALVKEEPYNNGDYVISIPLEKGENELIVTLSDEKGNSVSHTINIDRDTTGPVITLSKDYDSTTLAKDVVISGNVEDAYDFFINDKIVELDSDGKFSESIDLVPNDNIITIVAIDELGNKSVKTVTIKAMYQYIWLVIGVAAVLVIVLAVILIVKNVRSMPKAEKKEKVIIKNNPADDKKFREELKKEISDLLKQSQEMNRQEMVELAKRYEKDLEEQKEILSQRQAEGLITEEELNERIERERKLHEEELNREKALRDEQLAKMAEIREQELRAEKARMSQEFATEKLKHEQELADEKARLVKELEEIKARDIKEREEFAKRIEEDRAEALEKELAEERKRHEAELLKEQAERQRLEEEKNAREKELADELAKKQAELASKEELLNQKQAEQEKILADERLKLEEEIKALKDSSAADKKEAEELRQKLENEQNTLKQKEEEIRSKYNEELNSIRKDMKAQEDALKNAYVLKESVKERTERENKAVNDDKGKDVKVNVKKSKNGQNKAIKFFVIEGIVCFAFIIGAFIFLFLL